MITIHRAEDRHHADKGWLKSHPSFSFGEYYDTDNTHFGALRVFNDDIVAGGHGFGAHPHREMEIVTIVLRGEIKHEDSTGHTAVTGFGGIQRMSAGTGIIHSEINPHPDQPVELLQVWITPERAGLEPSYETSRYPVAELRNQLLPIVSNHSKEGEVAHIHQDATFYLSELDAGAEVSFQQKEGRRIYLFIIEGAVKLADGTVLARRDAARITELSELKLHAEQEAQLLLIDLP